MALAISARHSSQRRHSVAPPVERVCSNSYIASCSHQIILNLAVIVEASSGYTHDFLPLGYCNKSWSGAADDLLEPELIRQFARSPDQNRRRFEGDALSH
ncbi:hypothetical protein EVAR_79534_1 [Eumeta japonica]|uniref:Uncharacterized protein n=1 Tax=Eumeta variegata TaxID=151549 RepID=A0A4C1Y8R8_EUMVA|nr:hypothetical protein EVAR_79534_1 [Eumeta japonica]